MNRPTQPSSLQSRKRQIIYAAALAVIALWAVANLSVNRTSAQAGFGTFLINSTDDATDAQGCDAANCTLREAITAANAVQALSASSSHRDSAVPSV